MTVGSGSCMPTCTGERARVKRPLIITTTTPAAAAVGLVVDPLCTIWVLYAYSSCAFSCGERAHIICNPEQYPALLPPFQVLPHTSLSTITPTPRVKVLYRRIHAQHHVSEGDLTVFGTADMHLLEAFALTMGFYGALLAFWAWRVSVASVCEKEGKGQGKGNGKGKGKGKDGVVMLWGLGRAVDVTQETTHRFLLLVSLPFFL